MEVNILHAKADLSRLIEKAFTGEEVIIAKAGQPVVRLVAILPQAKRSWAAPTVRPPGRRAWHLPFLPFTDAEMDAFLA